MASGYDLKSSIISRMYCLEGRGAGGLLFIGVYINTYLTKSIRNCYNRLLRISFGSFKIINRACEGKSWFISIIRCLGSFNADIIYCEAVLHHEPGKTRQ